MHGPSCDAAAPEIGFEILQGGSCGAIAVIRPAVPKRGGCGRGPVGMPAGFRRCRESGGAGGEGSCASSTARGPTGTASGPSGIRDKADWRNRPRNCVISRCRQFRSRSALRTRTSSTTLLNRLRRTVSMRSFGTGSGTGELRRWSHVRSHCSICLVKFRFRSLKASSTRVREHVLPGYPGGTRNRGGRSVRFTAEQSPRGTQAGP